MKLKLPNINTVNVPELPRLTTSLIQSGNFSLTSFIYDIFCVGVMYSGDYDACDVTLSVYPHRASLKNMPDHGENRTYDLWNTSPMLCQLSYAVWSVRVCDISEQNLVPSISMLSNNNHDFSVLV